jgi:predicted O-methyltransferase YrrM
MGSELWTSTERYLEGLFVPEVPPLAETLAASRAAGLPAIQVTALQGRYLELLARAVGARRILEIGTLGGYSTQWLARALPPSGWLLSLELEPLHAEVARINLSRAGLSGRVEVRVGPALRSLEELETQRVEPFDLAFLDADKPNGAEYFEHALRRVRPGGLIVVDNVVRDGRVRDPGDADPAVRGTRRLLERMGREPGVVATVVPTVGSKGYDGMAIAIVLAR